MLFSCIVFLPLLPISKSNEKMALSEDKNIKRKKENVCTEFSPHNAIASHMSLVPTADSQC